MNRRLIWLLLIVLLVVVGGCKESPREVSIYRNIERIFMHDSQRFTLMVRKPDGTSTLLEINGGIMKCSPQFLFDVPSYKQMWLLLEQDKNWDGAVYTHRMIFHLRSPDDLQGSGWKRGKFGRGQTVVIE